MLFRVFRILFAVLGCLTGITITHTMIISRIEEDSFWRYPLYVLLGLVMGLLLFYLSGKIFLGINHFLGKVKLTSNKVTFYDIIVGVIGLIVGLVIANLLAIPFRSISIIGGPIAIVMNILLGLTGIYVAISKKDEFSLESFRTNRGKSGQKILDSCTIIDGRIIDIFQTGFLEGMFVVPLFIAKELQVLADSQDPVKRSRGKRGLEMLEKVKESIPSLDIVESEYDDQPLETDVKLMKFAQKTNGTIVTGDYNLNKIAAMIGLKVLNINDLANSVKRITLPGEEMTVSIVKKGKENGQGVGYLEDGTMVIVEKGYEKIGTDVRLVVSSVVQTSAGRLVFARIK